MTKVTPKIPILPECFRHLVDGYDPENHIREYPQEGQCDCQKQQLSLEGCPHTTKDKKLHLLLQEIPYKLGHIDHAKPHNREELREKLFEQIVEHLQHHQCENSLPAAATVDVEEGAESQNLLQPKAEIPQAGQCHVYRDLQKLFPAEYKQHFVTGKPQPRVKEARFLIKTVFSTNILLMLLKVIAIFFSNSMSVLTSMMDTALDVLSGFILMIAVKVAKKGIVQGDFTEALHHDTSHYRFIYAIRFETLGIMAFACIMGTIAAVLIGESAQNIAGIASGGAGEVTLDTYTITVMAINIVAKIGLSIWCALAAKRTDESADILLAYKDDCRNDVLSNSLGLTGALLAKYLGGAWAYCDPGAAILLSFYILWSWASTALENVRSLAGMQLKQDEQDAYMLQMLYQFTSIQVVNKINTFMVYESGSNKTIEIRMEVPNGLAIEKVHDVQSEIQRGFEKAEGIERCFIHIESAACEDGDDSY